MSTPANGTSPTITPEEAERLWTGATDGAYDDEPNNDAAPCANCGLSYGAHDGAACPGDEGDDGGFAPALTVDCLSPDARKGGALEARLIAAYRASEHIPYADMPPYDETDRENPWNVMNDLYIEGDFDASVDAEAFEKAFEWVEGWKDYTDTHR